MPSWLVNKELGINGLCKQGWRHRKCPSQNIRERFANPFEKSSEKNLKPLPYKLSNHGKQNFIPTNTGNINSKKSLAAHLGCVNALAFGPSGSGKLISGGDDRRVLVWTCPQFENTDKVRPVALPGEHDSNIFCLDFNGCDETKIFSGGNDERVLVHDTAAGGRTQDIFLHEAAVYGVDGHPHNRHIFATACADGRVQIFDLRQDPKEINDPFLVAVASRPFRPFLGVQFNPAEPRLLIAANQKEGARLWDIRHPRKSVLEYGSVEIGNYNGSRWHGDAADKCMSVRFNNAGTHIAALGRRMPPVIYEISSPRPFAELDSPGYYNSCTMKSVCFGGLNDDYVLAGSDDFNLYAWKIPDKVGNEGDDIQLINRASVVLRGHKSIVNQVRYNQSDGTIATAGVEKSIRLWSPFTIPRREELAGRNDPEVSGEYLQDHNETEVAIEGRTVSTRSNYMRLVQESHSLLTDDYQNVTTEENPRMLAFFDRLVQREMEDDRFSSSSSSDGDGPGGTFRPGSPVSSSSNSVISHVSELTESDNDGLVTEPSTEVDHDISTQSNTTSVGRFLNGLIQDRNSHTRDNSIHESPQQDSTSYGDVQQPLPSARSNDQDVARIDEEDEGVTISDLIAKKREQLKAHRLKKLKRARRLASRGFSSMTDNLRKYQAFRYQEKLTRAKKLVSLDTSSSSSSSTSSGDDTSEDENPARSSQKRSNLRTNTDHAGVESPSAPKPGDMSKTKAHKRKVVSEMKEEDENNLNSFRAGDVNDSRTSSSEVVDNIRDSSRNNGVNGGLFQKPGSSRILKDDQQMKDSILRALKEYEQEEEEKSSRTISLSKKKKMCFLIKDCEQGTKAEAIFDKSPKPSPDNDILPIIEVDASEKSAAYSCDKNMLSSNKCKTKENSSDNAKESCHVATSNQKQASECSHNSSIQGNILQNLHCDNNTGGENSLICKDDENVEKFEFKKGGGAVKGKRSYRKRNQSDD